MKKNYLFFLFCLVCMQFNAQTLCSDTQPDVGYAYAHAKTAYEANNLTHLKEYASRSLEAFKRVQDTLKSCNCPEAYSMAYDAIQALEKIVTVDKYDDARFYIKRAREYAKETIIELDICTKWSTEDHELAELESEKLMLEEAQKALKLKQEQIKLKLAAQKEKESLVKKVKLIDLNEAAIHNSVVAFNNLLHNFSCNSLIVPTKTNRNDLTAGSIGSIKTYYLNITKQITRDYLNKLDQCAIDSSTGN